MNTKGNEKHFVQNKGQKTQKLLLRVSNFWTSAEAKQLSEAQHLRFKFRVGPILFFRGDTNKSAQKLKANTESGFRPLKGVLSWTSLPYTRAELCDAVY